MNADISKIRAGTLLRAAHTNGLYMVIRLVQKGLNPTNAYADALEVATGTEVYVFLGPHLWEIVSQPEEIP